jgi:hypothetical protein
LIVDGVIVQVPKMKKLKPRKAEQNIQLTISFITLEAASRILIDFLDHLRHKLFTQFAANRAILSRLLSSCDGVADVTNERCREN